MTDIEMKKDLINRVPKEELHFIFEQYTLTFTDDEITRVKRFVKNGVPVEEFAQRVRRVGEPESRLMEVKLLMVHLISTGQLEYDEEISFQQPKKQKRSS